MKFIIDVNETFNQITASCTNQDYSATYTGYYEEGNLEQAIQEKIAPWINKCTERFDDMQTKSIEDLYLEGLLSHNEIAKETGASIRKINSVISSIKPM